MSEQNMKILKGKDISKILDIALANAYKLMKRPDFPAIKVSARRYIVTEDAFKRWLDEQAAKKAAGTGADAVWHP